MHVTKGGLLGQTFALAKFDDSFGGKKSHTRRSKEERKGMVETFIKRYQKLNNGDFPSLSLTRKEVGGSFYTVREIVREIIQENRVLGPPKLPPGDQNMENLDSFSENYALGSTSTDLDVHMVPPKDTQTLLKEYEFRSAEVLNTTSIIELHQRKLDSDSLVDRVMNKTERIEEVKDAGYKEFLVERGMKVHTGDEELLYVETSQVTGGAAVEATHVTVTNDNNEEQTYTELQERRGNNEQKNDGTDQEPRVSQISEFVVETTHVTACNEAFREPKHIELLMEGGMGGQEDESNEIVANQSQIHQSVGAFPLRPVSDIVYNIDEKSSEREVMVGDLEEKETGNMELAIGNNKRVVCNEMHLFDNSTEALDIKSEEEITSLLPESKPTMTSKKAHNDPLPKESLVLSVHDTTDIQVEDTLPADEKTSRSNDQNLNGSSRIPLQQSTLGNRTVNTNKSNDQPGGRSQTERNDAALNRMNLESWKAASKKPSGQETSGLVTFIRAFVSAFVKFWFE